MKRIRLFLGFCALTGLLPTVRADEMRAAIMADSYIESDGTQYVDLGYAPKKTSRFELEYSILTTNDTRDLFGVADHAGGAYQTKFALYFQTLRGVSRQHISCGNSWSEGWGETTFGLLNQRFTASLDLSTGKGTVTSLENYSSTVTATPLTNDMVNTLTLFANHGYNSIIDKPANARIYWFKVYEGNELKMDLIPYSREAVTGFLDRLSGRVFTASNAKGNPLTFGTDDGFVLAKRSELTGLATGYRANPKTKVEIDFALTHGDQWQRVFGADDTGDFRCGLYLSSADSFAFKFGDGDKSGIAVGTTVAKSGERRVFTLDGPAGMASFRRFGESEPEYSVNLDKSKASKTATEQMAIFGQCTKDGVGEKMGGPCGMRLYGMKIWDDGKLIHSYEPRIVDSVPCLYDTVVGKMLAPDPNFSPRYALTPGGNILCMNTTGGAPVCDAYLEGHNGPVINTGYIASGATRVEDDYVYLHFATNMASPNLWGANGVAVSQTSGLRRLYQYFEKNRNQKWAVTLDSLEKWPGVSASLDIMKRVKAFVDLPNDTYSLTSGGTTSSGSIGAKVPVGSKLSLPMAIFSMLSGKSSYSANGANMRLYGLKVLESGTPVHEYVPAGFAGQAGLYDLFTDAFLTNQLPAKGAFTLGGAGVGGAGMVFETQPQGGTVKIGESMTLKAFAPGAAGLQWLKDGEPVVGATGPKLEVAWSRSSKPVNYQCLAYYAIAGYALSDVATVESEKRGMVLIVK